MKDMLSEAPQVRLLVASGDREVIARYSGSLGVTAKRWLPPMRPAKGCAFRVWVGSVTSGAGWGGAIVG